MGLPKPLQSLLKTPSAYLAYQSLVGGIRARKLCIQACVRRTPGMVVLDIGCGPGYTAQWLQGSKYYGFDISPEYIAYARKRFGSVADFRCDLFTDAHLPELPKADFILMMGLLHHLSDADSAELLGLARRALKPDGALITLDGCYRDGQSRIARYLLDSDRGQYVRDEPGYVRIARGVFSRVTPDVREDLFRVPYTTLILTCRP